MGTEEIILAVVVDLATKNWYCQSISCMLPLIW